MSERIITGRSQELLAQAARQLAEHEGDFITTGINTERLEELEKARSLEPMLSAPRNRHERRAAAAKR